MTIRNEKSKDAFECGVSFVSRNDMILRDHVIRLFLCPERHQGTSHEH